jgi:hypothetical protein
MRWHRILFTFKYYLKMFTKEYLEKLKKEDYLAWDHLVNDPMIVGTDNSISLIIPCILVIILLGVLVAIFI